MTVHQPYWFNEFLAAIPSDPTTIDAIHKWAELQLVIEMVTRHGGAALAGDRYATWWQSGLPQWIKSTLVDGLWADRWERAKILRTLELMAQEMRALVSLEQLTPRQPRQPRSQARRRRSADPPATKSRSRRPHDQFVVRDQFVGDWERTSDWAVDEFDSPILL